jgi:hypothetical protein
MLGIDLWKGDPAYFGGSLPRSCMEAHQEESATKTYRVFESHSLTSRGD